MVVLEMKMGSTVKVLGDIMGSGFYSDPPLLELFQSRLCETLGSLHNSQRNRPKGNHVCF